MTSSSLKSVCCVPSFEPATKKQKRTTKTKRLVNSLVFYGLEHLIYGYPLCLAWKTARSELEPRKAQKKYDEPLRDGNKVGGGMRKPPWSSDHGRNTKRPLMKNMGPKMLGRG